LAQVLTENFEHYASLTRQEAKFMRQRVGISRQVMADWLEGCAKAIKHSPPENKELFARKSHCLLFETKSVLGLKKSQRIFTAVTHVQED
jgi:transposase